MLNIILKKKIQNIGEKYKQIKVKSGFAMNYLIPNNQAVLATKSNIKINNEIIKQKTKKKLKNLEYIKLIEKLNLIFYIKTEKNKYNLTKEDIQNKLIKNNIFLKKKYINFKRKDILLGNNKIKIKINKNILTYLKIKILEKK